MESSGLEDQEIYNFQLVEFLQTHGSKSKKKRSLDIIPLSWMSFDTKEGKLIAKFMPPPYDPESIDLLYSLIESEPESWRTYLVKIRGHAKTYSEVVKRLKVLENEDYAFTENEGQELKAKYIESKYRRNNLKLSQQTSKAMLVLRIESEDEQLNGSTDEEANSSSDESISTSHKKHIFKKPTFKPKTKTASTSSGMKNSKSNTESFAISGKTVSTIKGKSNTDPNPPSSSTIHKIKESVQPKDINKSNETAQQDDQICVKNKKDSNGDKRNNSKSHNDRKKDTVLIISILNRMAVDIRELKENQQIIIQQFRANDHFVEKNFTSKYMLKIPFDNLKDFNNFDTSLACDTDEMQREFISSLNAFLDRQLNLVKSCTNICRKYLLREVIIKFTVTRKKEGKFSIKETNVYKCIMTVISHTHKYIHTRRAVTEQDFSGAMAKVINNAKDWDGERQKRALKKSKPKHRNEEQLVDDPHHSNTSIESDEPADQTDETGKE